MFSPRISSTSDGRQNLQCRIKATSAWIIGIFVAYLLLSSAIAHLKNPYRFLASIYEYRIFPRWCAEALAVILPFMHIAIAISLIASYEQMSTFAIGFLSLFCLRCSTNHHTA